ncbi:hypothetical protein FLK61_34275 [Paenalkalicoccus suaedae]|uniref:Uncharacterized protein n=1 Tax=Paenalkalicoccus suaedae TaxID=2592382 RepID=A0A859FHQ1_9BACI|nr:hypothetical protein [Paenalkalicoccus suaedae]QKS71691.1 hypothetical protein FLK61_33980 [Paenalkalicoccus suaedae]QKS71745.1 hypothetical protein FLK61_34275 [Paenalkalicoccus suaedae]
MRLVRVYVEINGKCEELDLEINSSAEIRPAVNQAVLDKIGNIDHQVIGFERAVYQ